MGKFYGPIGYVETVETRPGIYEEIVTERNYFGDLLSNNGNWTPTSDSTNDDFTINNQISIIADPFAYQKFNTMKYVEYLGFKWKIKSANVNNFPRIILTVGGVYNGKQT